MTPPRFNRRPTLADIVAAEQGWVQAGQAEACGKVCDDGCHGPRTCVRAEHPHDPDADMGVHEATGRPVPKGNVHPHAAYDPDGQLVQWTCLPGDHDGLTDEQRADAVAVVKAEKTRELLDQIDPQLLVQLLREGGHLT